MPKENDRVKHHSLDLPVSQLCLSSPGGARSCRVRWDPRALPAPQRAAERCSWKFRSARGTSVFLKCFQMAQPSHAGILPPCKSSANKEGLIEHRSLPDPENFPAYERRPLPAVTDGERCLPNPCLAFRSWDLVLDHEKSLLHTFRIALYLLALPNSLPKGQRKRGTSGY